MSELFAVGSILQNKTMKKDSGKTRRRKRREKTHWIQQRRIEELNLEGRTTNVKGKEKEKRNKKRENKERRNNIIKRKGNKEINFAILLLVERDITLSS